MSGLSSTEERRKAPRRRTLKGAKACFGDYRYSFDCIVRNLSEDGALVRSDHSLEIPDDFYLFDPNDLSLQKAEVVWRTERDLGVRFLGEPLNVHTSLDPKLARFRFM
jgi:hypothetical protein